MNVKPVIIKTTTRDHEIIPLSGFVDDKNEYVYVRYMSVKSAENSGFPIEYLSEKGKENEH